MCMRRRLLKEHIRVTFRSFDRSDTFILQRVVFLSAHFRCDTLYIFVFYIAVKCGWVPHHSAGNRMVTCRKLG